jgi:(p)ppGpp synthase/HD superfamily hydrolase
MPISPALSERYEEALRIAAVEHREQNRKGNDLPYITHVVHVAQILCHYGFPEDVVVAGLLHDVVEDQNYPLAKIEEQFGPQVAEIVAALSERKRDDEGEKRPWEARKEEALEILREASTEAVAVKAADTLHNAHCLAQDLRREGAHTWTRFSRGPDATQWYYGQVLQLARERLDDHPLVAELSDALEDVVRAIQETQ